MRWGVLLTGSAVFLGVVWWLSTGSLAEVSPPSPGAAAPSAPSRPPPPPERSELGQPAELEPEAARTPEPAPAPPTPPPPAGAGAAPPPTLTPRPGRESKDPAALARESELLARAKQEVVENPEAALGSLQEYAQQFPDAALAHEADLVRVEAFLRLGRRDEAETLAKKLTAADPAAKKALKRLFSDVRRN